ncbi:Methionine--tRNA ligase [Jeotgalibaca dankookensis]|uniref:Methionine--tRNA ligase n=1 Tax=Jeotgalibaca dankookensis TaxID=708126 RepID=A0A1S6INZ3_9LACT|nr:hypothetical protein [Jeotgalibaca dankookensis]AQS53267.1 Methionine--tRNA ligase [Jeotgalibaca dankookensis]
MDHVKEIIEMSDLDKIDIRVGTILKIEEIEKSDKMMKLVVDFGMFERTILVGMKNEREESSEVIGTQAD